MIRGIQLRAVLVPLGVAAILIGVLGWYGWRWIPRQEQYLNERNVRLLKTISTQIRSKVNNFDLAMDHALESFPSLLAADKPTALDDFDRYVKLFAPELEIVRDADDIVKRHDPPYVSISIDEGTKYLYLGFAHRVKGTIANLTARVDINRLVAPYLASQTELDALLLVDHAGEVIAQYSPSGVEVSRASQLASQLRGTQAGSSQGGKSDPLEGFVTSDKPVTINGAAYRIYVEPVQLSLLSADQKDRVAEEWRVCGLVRIDHFRGAASAISPAYWLMLIAALGVLCFVVPLLKVRVLHPRERFRRGDGVLVAASSFLLTALLTFVLLDVYYFGSIFRGERDRQLHAVAEELRAGLVGELAAMSAELDVQVAAFDRDLHDGTLHQDLEPQVVSQGNRFRCVPEWACTPGLFLGVDLAAAPPRYPYFNLITWTDRNGDQRIKRTPTTAITPFINIREANIPYFEEANRARQFHFDNGTAPRGVAVVRSPNTGEPLTVLWQALPPSDMLDLAAASLATKPLSVLNPVLPKNIHFAVVDRTGRVMYHSEPTRALNENFFDECEDDAALRAQVLGRRSDTLGAPYRGRRHRLYVTPITLSAADSRITDPQWSLVVFEDHEVLDTLNLETLTLAAAMFVAYGLILAAGWGAIYLRWSDCAVKWFWPDHTNGKRYRLALLWNAGLTAVWIGVLAVASPSGRLIGTIVIALAALAGTFALLAIRRQPTALPTWQRDFRFARVSLLFVIAALPAITAFSVAYEFENALRIRRGQLHISDALVERTARIRREMRSVRLCDDRDQACDNVKTYLERRLRGLDDASSGGAPEPWDVHITPFAREVVDTATDDGLRSARIAESPAWLVSMLARAHLPYNETAIDLEVALPSAAGGGPGNPDWTWSSNMTGTIVHRRGETLLSADVSGLPPGLWLIGILAIAGTAAVVRFAVEPLYVLGLYLPPGLLGGRARERSGNLLVVGPPGAGKTEVLRTLRGVHVFDVRTLTFEGKDAAIPHVSSLGPVTLPAAVAPATAEPASWTDVINATVIPERHVLAFDHFEHRLDEPAFRDAVLPLLEDLQYRRRCRVAIASTHEPVDYLREVNVTADLDRWRRLLQSFHQEIVSVRSALDDTRLDSLRAVVRARCPAVADQIEPVMIAECASVPPLLSVIEDVAGELQRHSEPTTEDVLFEIGLAAEPFYQGMWAACSQDEKLALCQLAEEGLVNPRNIGTIAHLQRRGIVRRDPTFAIMNETFRRFVLHEVPAETLSAWERRGVRLPWTSITTTLLTMAIGLVGLLLLTQEQLVDAWVGYAPALAPAVPTVMKLLSSLKSRIEPSAA